MHKLSIEEIMERLGRLSRLGTAVHCRTDFPPGASKWYVSMSGVQNNIACDAMSGESPEAAIRKTWESLALQPNPPIQFRYFCKPDEPIPGKGPQVWVRWNQDIDDWSDVEPDKDRSRHASEICPYSEHKWREKMHI